ncbi:LuxR C-terminal-related transcriptional regulator [Streptomyces sp. NPDC054855]
MTKVPHTHAEDLCEAGSALYALALREGRLRRGDAEPAPCLRELGLLRPDTDDSAWLSPVSPALALSGMLLGVEEGIVRRRRLGARLATAFEPLMALAPGRPEPAPASHAVTVLRGFPEIDEAINRAMADTTKETLVIQPGGTRPTWSLAKTRAREQKSLDRGARLRTLYQHTTRHALPVVAHYEQLDGDVEVRTLDEVSERLFLFDRTVAFIPANKSRDVALEIRLPALVEHFARTFECLWALATPMYPQPTQLDPGNGNGITTRRQAIAELLVDGLTDTEIAARLGMNVRTARVHIAKLADTLGSRSRTQLGYLIGRSDILRHPR